MKAKKGIIVVAFAVVALAASLGVLSYVSYAKGFKEFIADGYILKPSAEVNVMTDVNEQHYFSQGTKYLAKYGSKISFTDAAGEEVSLNKEQFIHYADGSLGSFTKGVIMDVTDLSDEQYGYYNLTQNTILVKNGRVYEVSTRGEAMNLEEFVWKITDTEYMLVSPEVTLQLGNANTITLPDYAQIKYVDNGIVRIVHQQGTYQTVSSEALLTTAAGAELNLVGKNFYIDGKPGISLDRMSLSDDSYIDLDANADSPEIKIPKFNVVNGKNGASGANGADGEDGTDGESGLEGVAGGDGGDGAGGAAGLAGSSGGSGGRGSDGSDGLEGDSGVMGYDGKPGSPGTNGTDGKREDEISGVVAADVYVRPVVTMDNKAGDDKQNYNITANGIDMKLNLVDTDQAIKQDTLNVRIIDRETMQDVTAIAEATRKGWANDLYNSGSAVIKTDVLSPDKEYILMVEGEYYSEEDDADGKFAQLFTKIFRTNSLGVTLKKLNVTDKTVTLVTDKTAGSQVENYDVVLYFYDTNGNKTEVLRFSKQTEAREFLCDNANSAIQNGGIKSNTVYYAALDNVIMSGSSTATPSEGTEIEIHTLKSMPYGVSNDTNKTVKQIAMITPDVSTDNKSKTISIKIPDQIVDVDNGIVGYRYELYPADDIKAVADGTKKFSELSTPYTMTTDALKNHSFQVELDEALPEQIKYVGRVVVLFNDNENDVELATGFSGTGQLEKEKFPIVEMSEVSEYADSLTGTITITDEHGMLLPYMDIGYNYPLYLTVQSEYNDKYPMELTRASATEFNSSNGKAVFKWEQTGLRKNSNYNISLQGPVRVKQSSDPFTYEEEHTYLAGATARTHDTAAIRLVGNIMTNPNVAFQMRINFTRGDLGGDITEEFYEHEVKAMEEVVLQLYQRDNEGTETKIGDDLPLKDLWTEQYYKENPALQGNSKEWQLKSTFYNCGWVDFSKTSLEQKDSVIAKGWQYGYYTLQPNEGLGVTDDNPGRLEVTPRNFGVDNNDSLFYSGNVYIIRARRPVLEDGITTDGPSTADYTQHNNDIGFAPDGNRLEFKLESRHARPDDVNSQVNVRLITKSQDDRSTTDPNCTKNDPSLNDDTVVGMIFEGLYRYNDVKNITFGVYKIDEDQPNPDPIAYDADNQYGTQDYPEGRRPNLYYAMSTEPRDPSSTTPQAGYDPSNIKDAAYLAEWAKDANGNYEVNSTLKKLVNWNSKKKVASLVGKIKVAFDENLAAQGSTQVGTVKVYFNDLDYTARSKDAVSQGRVELNEWKDQSGTINELLRGGRYFIAYETEVSAAAGMDDMGGRDHTYPDCTYHNTLEQIPFYRSGVFELAKQTPKIERYPVTETAGSVTWNYRIVDPDNTVDTTKGFELVTATASNMTTGATNPVMVTLKPGEIMSDYIGGVYVGDGAQKFKPLTLTVPDKSYYTISIYYKRTSSLVEASQPLTSYPVYKQEYRSVSSAVFSNTAGIADTTNLGLLLQGQEGEAALVNQGGYRYMLTIWGNYRDTKNPGLGSTLDGIAALRVTFYGKNAAGTKYVTEAGVETTDIDQAMKVVYDPIYLDIQSGGLNDTGGTPHPYAYAYIDSSSLAAFLDKKIGIKTAEIQIGAYYNTGVGGFGVDTYLAPENLKTEIPDAYTSFADGTGSHGTEVYALKWMTAAGTYSYKTLVEDRNGLTFSDAPTGTVGKSIFLPMNIDKSSAAAFEEQPAVSTPGALAGKLGVRYAQNAMSLYDAKDRLSGKVDGVIPIEISYDRTGALITSSGVGNYVTVEKLALYTGDDFQLPADVKTVVLSDIFPAIEARTSQTSNGVSGFYMEFKALGTGAKQDRQLYARVYEVTNNGTKLLDLKSYQNELQADGRLPLHAYFYEAEKAVNPTTNKEEYVYLENNAYETKSTFAPNRALTIQKEGNEFFLPVRVKGLKESTKYKVIIFAYDSDNKAVDLYCIEHRMTGHEYYAETRGYIDMQINPSLGYTYTTYNDKSLNIGFRVGAGEDGMGIRVYYSIYDMENKRYVFEKRELAPNQWTLQTGQPYFSNDFTKNKAMTVALPPGGGGEGAETLAMDHKYRIEVEVWSSEGKISAPIAEDKEKKYYMEFTTPKKLADPTVYIQGLNSKDDYGNLQITADVVVQDNNRTMKEITVQLLNQDGIQIAEQKQALDGASPRKTATVVFSNNASGTQLIAGQNYTLKLVVPCDTDNDGKFDDEEPKTMESAVSLSSAISATVGASADASKVTIFFSNLQNFANVKTVSITVYQKNSTSLTAVASGSQNVTVSDAGFALNYNWTAPTAKGTYQYEVQIQYKNAEGRTIGKDTTTMIYNVGGSGSGIGRLFTSLFGSDKKVADVTSGDTAK